MLMTMMIVLTNKYILILMLHRLSLPSMVWRLRTSTGLLWSVRTMTVCFLLRLMRKHGITSTIIHILVLTLTLCSQPGDWRSGQEPALPRSIRSEYFPILIKNT